LNDVDFVDEGIDTTVSVRYHHEMQSDATPSSETLEARNAALEAALMAERARANALETRTREFETRTAELTAERDRLRKAYREMQLELELLRRRIFVAKAERVDSSQLELEFARKRAELDALSGLALTPEPPANVATPPAPKPRPKPTGRRDVHALALPEERVELPDPELEGKAERIGFEESAKLMWRRGGFVRLVVARAKYKVAVTDGDTLIEAAALPAETFARSLAAPSLMAHVISSKFCDGLPLFRQEDMYARLGVKLDRGTMCRWLEDAGATLGATVVKAMRDEAMASAFCLATDATGVAVQPLPTADKKRQPCRRGHFFVIIADRDHVFFEYQVRETSKTVSQMFRGFAGYVQADAKSVYDILFTPPPERPPPDEDSDPDVAARYEVGCWAHARRKFWEAAMAKNVVAREALVRIGRFFERDAQWSGRPPAEIKSLRDKHLRPEVDAFFAWARPEFDKVKGERGTLRSALGYAVRQQAALVRFFDDGRLKLDNNRSERELRRVAVGRKAWLFVGSDDHAQAAGNLLSLVASARLHGLDPELYLRDVLRVLAHWPTDRYLELAPRYWNETRAKLVPDELDAELGPLTLPPTHVTEKQPTAD
jgi:transposase